MSLFLLLSPLEGEGCEMIERPTERDQMSMFLRSLHPRFARHLTGVPFQDFRSLVQALFDVDDGISRGLWSDIIPSQILRERVVDHLRAMETYVLRTFSIDDLVIIPMRDHCRYPGVISPFTASSSSSVQQYPSVHPHTVTVRPSFQFQRPQTSIPRHEQSRPHRRRQRTYSDLGMPLDRAFERLRSTGHRTDYCASLRHTIQDLIDSGAVSFPVSTTDTDLGPDMTADSFPAIPHMQFLLLRAYTITFWTPRALIFTGHFDTLLVYFGTTLLVGQYIEIRLLQLRFTMSDEIAPITLTTLYEMMVDLTRRVERIELILSGSIVIERSSRSSDAFIATFDFIDMYFGCLTSTTSPTFSVQQHSSSISLATPTRPPSRLRGPPLLQFLRSDFTLVDDVGDTFQI
ncbi:hypothetical protein CK203_061840 [Vitis vinifera]|uniref:Uncharacterized protein n=1 Tax=Vitis vinifera TaxID=29760 RepID=A0A438GC27_VITVI|nr:hypothetical protein CK203_061840 [Vitis vinifera]